MSTKPDWIITAAELKPLLGKVVLIDVREPEEHAEGYIETCKLIPLGDLLSRAGELDKEADTVIYCAHGIRSMQGLMALKSLGFKKLRSLEDGIVAWDEYLASL